VPPAQTIDEQGAEILRLWVGYEDYRSDIAYSPAIIRSLVDSYRKIRNTFRFMLGNLDGFDPARDAVEPARMAELDRWMLARFGKYLARLDRAYDEYNFHHVFHATIELVTVELSAFYLDVIKDRLYCEAAGGALRRSAQTALWIMARDMARALSPVLSFTAEEVWRHLPGAGRAESVFLAGFPAPDPAFDDDALLDRWSAIRDVRREVTKVLEAMRAEKRIGNALEAEVTLRASGATLELLGKMGDALLTDVFLVSRARVEEGKSELEVVATPCGEAKCPRCWRLGHGVGADPARPELCARCAAVVAGMAR